MEEQSTRYQNPVRTAQEVAARRSQSVAAKAPSQPAYEQAEDATHMAGQFAVLGTETLTVWTDATQQAMRDVMELSAQAAEQRARQLTQWQQTNLDLLHEAQRAAFRWYTLWPEFLCNPVGGYHRALAESIEVTHRVFETTRRHAEAVAQSYDHLERAAETTTRTLGDTFRDASTRMRDVYARSDRLHAA